MERPRRRHRCSRSRNRNFLDDDEINRTRGQRPTLDRPGRAPLRHRRRSSTALIAAVDHESEEFHARDVDFGGATDQDRDRTHQRADGRMARRRRARWSPTSRVRRDRFNRFKDATTLRASAAGGRRQRLLARWLLRRRHRPADLLRSLRLLSRIVSLAIRRLSRNAHAASKLRSAIARDHSAQRSPPTASGSATRSSTSSIPPLSSPAPINRAGEEPPLGHRGEARLAARPIALRLTANYAYLKATEPGDARSQVREARRPKHSGSIAPTATSGRLTYGASLAYTGAPDRHGLRHLPVPPGHARLLLAGRRAHRLSVAERDRAVRPRRQRVRRPTTRTRSAIAPKGGASMPASALLSALASPPSTCAPTNISCCSPGRTRSPASAFSRRIPQESPLWRLATAASSQPRLARAVLGQEARCRPDDGRRRASDRR